MLYLILLFLDFYNLRGRVKMQCLCINDDYSGLSKFPCNYSKTAVLQLIWQGWSVYREAVDCWRHMYRYNMARLVHAWKLACMSSVLQNLMQLVLIRIS